MCDEVTTAPPGLMDGCPFIVSESGDNLPICGLVQWSPHSLQSGSTCGEDRTKDFSGWKEQGHMAGQCTTERGGPILSAGREDPNSTSRQRCQQGILGSTVHLQSTV